MPVTKRFLSTKTYGHDLGLSVAFRQHKADSHCRFLHGYALSIKIVFEAMHLDDRNWVVDFGGLKEIKAELIDLFDHKTLVASDDPAIEWFREAKMRGIIDMVEVDKIGAESFAELVAASVQRFIKRDDALCHRVRLRSVEVAEHGANSATVEFDR